MRRYIMPLITAAGLLLTGCLVPSIHPLYTESDILPVNGIEGDWMEEDDINAWTFTPLDDNTYRLTYVESGDTSEFAAVFVLLDEDHLFMDVYPEGPHQLSDAYKMHLAAVHTFWLVDMREDSLTVSALDSDWLSRVIDTAGLSIAYESLDNNEVLLTATTEELQIWLAGIADEPAAFSPLVLTRPK